MKCKNNEGINGGHRVVMKRRWGMGLGGISIPPNTKAFF